MWCLRFELKGRQQLIRGLAIREDTNEGPARRLVETLSSGDSFSAKPETREIELVESLKGEDCDVQFRGVEGI